MRIKFLNLNIWLGGKLFDNTLEFIKKEDPNILILQEVYDSKDQELERRFRTMEILRKELGFPHNFFSSACYKIMDGAKLESGNAIFSKFPIASKETLFFDVSYGEKPTFEDPDGDYTYTPRNMQHAEIDLGSNKLNVFNLQGIWGFDPEDNERRLKTSEDIIKAIKNEENVILAGDFNVSENSKSIGNIEKYLKNIFKNELKSSFNLKQKTNPIFADLVVDFIFTSKNLQIVDHYCPQVDVSDHLPLVCVFEI